MKLRALLLYGIVSLCLGLYGCRSTEGGSSEGTVVLGIPADISTLNPIFVQEVTEGEICELIYPMLVDATFDTTIGILRFEPSLARSWEFRNEHRDVVFHLRSEARWSDGAPVTAHDVRFTYELYGDPDLGSIRQSALDGLLKTSDGSVDVGTSIEVLDDSTIVFRFARAYAGQLFDAGLPIVPAHIFAKVPRTELRTHAANRQPVGAGPFVLESWKPLQELVLIPNAASVLPGPAKLERLVFRILPDNLSRLQQLKRREIDVMSGLKPIDVSDVKSKAPFVHIISIPGREYFFLGWNNVDGATYAATAGASIRPHPLFGSSNVRRALTLAINRKEMAASLRGGYGREALGPISSLFRWAVNNTLTPLPYDPGAASRLLSADGWLDRDRDGILEKKNKRFSFSTIVPAGDQFYLDVANLVQRQLREIGIEMRIQPIDGSVFFPTLMEKKYDACVAGFEVPLQIQMDDFWNSDLYRYPFNIVSFRSRRVDQILEKARASANEIDAAPLWKEFQAVLHQEQPCTFLFWSDKLVGVNDRVQGTTISVLGTTYHAWEWHTGESSAR